MNTMLNNPFLLTGKTILVTGASSGIGQATAILCSRLEATVIITARNAERLNETFELLENRNLEHKQILADITNEEEIKNLVEQLPRLDGLVNNAGIVKTLPVAFYTKEAIDEIFNVNIFAPMLLTKLVVKRKKMNKLSSIVFTSSVGGVFTVSMGNGIYSASKCAIDGYMKTAALELASKGIRCNSVNPGMVETKLITGGAIGEEQLKTDQANYPLGRFGRPEDIAAAIVFLLSDGASWITGTALKIDGGLTL